MTDLPLISIVVPSLNQGAFLGETLQSLADQDYPRLEVIVQDGGSTDGSVDIAREYARRFPETFHVHVEPDHGQAHALNLGFAKTHGEILGFLNSDDTLFPGCLLRVAREIDPTRNRWIVFGRSVFTGTGPYVGIEHPAEFVGRYEQLAIWERGFNTLPQPSVFWHRQVWETCGGVNEKESHVLDYDLFCRFSAQYSFHKVDELWSTYRWHVESKSAQRSESEVLALSVAASRRNWPGWWQPLRWRLARSLRRHERHAHDHERARHHARRAEAAFAEKRTATALAEFIRTFVASPAMAWHRLLQPLLAGKGLHWIERLLFHPATSGAESEEFTGRYADGWIGPVYRQILEVPANADRLLLSLQHNPQPDGHHQHVRVEIRLEGRAVKTADIERGGPFELEAGLKDFRDKPCRLELSIRPYFIPSAIESGSQDHRKLTVLLLASTIQPAEGRTA